MARVRLLHPIRCTITPIDKDKTKYDDNAGEPIGTPVYGTPYQVSAQIEFPKRDKVEAARSGAQLKSSGYLLMKIKDLEKLGVEVFRGDKVTKMGKLDVSYYIVGFGMAAHYADQNGAALVQTDFADRWPSS